MKGIISEENGGNPNEKVLIHGTPDSKAILIAEHGFDDRFWANGGFGLGQYFTEDAPYSRINNNKN